MHGLVDAAGPGGMYRRRTSSRYCISASRSASTSERGGAMGGRTDGRIQPLDQAKRRMREPRASQPHKKSSEGWHESSVRRPTLCSTDEAPMQHNVPPASAPLPPQPSPIPSPATRERPSEAPPPQQTPCPVSPPTSPGVAFPPAHSQHPRSVKGPN